MRQLVGRLALIVSLPALLALLAPAPPGHGRPAPPLPVRPMEALGRGVVAIPKGEGRVFVSWRLLGTDPDGAAFHLYRTTGEGKPVRLTKVPLAKVTHHVDSGVDVTKANAYFVRPVLDGNEGEASRAFTLPADSPARPYLAIPLKTLPGHTPNDVSVGDLDGDGEYELVVKQEMRPRDNARKGATGETKL
jgi:rhamnogalacturonan endolyase